MFRSQSAPPSTGRSVSKRAQSQAWKRTLRALEEENREAQRRRERRVLQAAVTPPVLRPSFFAKQAQKREWKRTLKAVQADNRSAQKRREQRRKEAEADAKKKAKVLAEKDSRTPSFTDLLWPFTRTSPLMPRSFAPRKEDSKRGSSFFSSMFSCFHVE
jgi:hypothetical protein